MFVLALDVCQVVSNSRGNRVLEMAEICSAAQCLFCVKGKREGNWKKEKGDRKGGKETRYGRKKESIIICFSQNMQLYIHWNERDSSVSVLNPIQPIRRLIRPYWQTLRSLLQLRVCLGEHLCWML